LDYLKLTTKQFQHQISVLFGTKCRFPGEIDFRSGSLVILLIGLRVSFLTLVDGFRSGSLVGLLIGLHICCLTLLDIVRGGSFVGLLLRLRLWFLH